jgi:outer membrane protein, heavy metal efflux system
MAVRPSRRVLGTSSHPFSAARGAVLALVATAAAAGESVSVNVAAAPSLLETPALQALIDEALAARPELSRARAEIDAARQVGPRARALPDPMFELGIQNDGFTGLQIGQMETSFVSIMTSQTLPWPGKLEAAGRVADLLPRQAQTVATRLTLGVAAEVRRGYLELMLARGRLELLRRLAEVWKKSVELARTRYEVGDGAQSDVLRAQLELNRVQQRRVLLETDARQTLLALNRLRGKPWDSEIETVGELHQLAPPASIAPESVLEAAREQSPERAAAQLALEAAEEAGRVARQAFFPDLTFKAGVMPRGATLPPMWSLSVGTTLPAWAAHKQHRALDEAEARVKAARFEVAFVDELLALRVRQRATALIGLRENVRLYREGLLVQSQATAESTLSQYQVGKVGFLAVLEANAGYLADEEACLRATADAWRLAIAEAELSLAEVPPAGGAAMQPATSMSLSSSAPGLPSGAAPATPSSPGM